MAKFITQYGNYTLVLKPEGVKPTYDHTGKPVRVEGTVMAEFNNIRGTAIGVYETNDEEIIRRLRANPNFNKAFKEVTNESEIKAATTPQAKSAIKLSKGVLAACNKNELISIANQYSLRLEDTMTKTEIIAKIMEAQEREPMAQPQPVQHTAAEGGITKIIQTTAGQAS